MAIPIASGLLTLLQRHPALTVEPAIGERFGDLVAERLDLAVRNGRSEDASSVARVIATFGRALVAAPACPEQHGIPQ